MKQNTQNRTYITIRIHKHNNKNTQFTKLNKNIQNIQPYIYNDTKWIQKNMIQYGKRKNLIRSKIHMIYIPSNNVRHPVTKTFTTLHPTTLHPTTLHFTSLHLSTLQFFPFKLHPTTLHSTSLHLSSLHFFPFKLHPTTLHYTCRHFNFSHLNFTQLHFTSLHFTTLVDTSIFPI